MRPIQATINKLDPKISIHAPIVGCDHFFDTFYIATIIISIHAPIVGCDNNHVVDGTLWYLFQSTHPSWGATLTPLFLMPKVLISIHAPIVGCDVIPSDKSRIITYFNPRTHRGVRPADSAEPKSIAELFQSTHPSWGATVYDVTLIDDPMDFNPRTHRGVRHIILC